MVAHGVLCRLSLPAARVFLDSATCSAAERFAAHQNWHGSQAIHCVGLLFEDANLNWTGVQLSEASIALTRIGTLQP